MKTKNDVNVGVVGVGVLGMGNMGGSHAKRLLEGEVPGAKLAGVCDVDPERIAGYPETPGWTDAETMFREGGLDAVLIATPHYSHVPLGIAALKAGLHVLVEKPIAVHKADAERLLSAYTGSDQVFSAMFNQRTDPRYQWLRSQIQSGALGKINRVNWIITDWFRSEAYYANGGWRATWRGEGGGVLVNQCPHQLDLWQWLFGMPDHVHAFCGLGKFHDIEVEDDVTAYLAYENGLSGVFITTTGESPGTNRLEIAAENGKIVIEGKSIQYTKNDMPTSEFSSTTDQIFGRPDTTVETLSFEDQGEQHLGILKNFTQAIRGEAELMAPALEGIHSVELGNAILFSGLSHKTVSLPLDGEAYEKKLGELIEGSTFQKRTVASKTASTEDMNQSF